MNYHSSHFQKAFVFLLLVALLFVIPGFQREANAYVVPTQIYFPLPTNTVWYGTTYSTHGTNYNTYRSAIDITDDGGHSMGQPVYAMASGNVVSYDASNGQIVVKVSTPLITTNAAYIGSWYYIYAHMTDISVKKNDSVSAGQQVGKVGAVGEGVTGPHLHVNIISADNGAYFASNSVGTEYAISPYYVYGFVDQLGGDVSYFRRDKQGSAVTQWLMNHVPVSTTESPLVFDVPVITNLSVDSENVTLSWSSVPKAATYEVYCFPSETGDFIGYKHGFYGTSGTIPRDDLNISSNGGTYYFAVLAVGSITSNSTLSARSRYAVPATQYTYDVVQTMDEYWKVTTEHPEYCSSPYQTTATGHMLSRGWILHITAKVRNSYGNIWYQFLNDNGQYAFVYEDDVTYAGSTLEEAAPRITGACSASEITASSASITVALSNLGAAELSTYSIDYREINTSNWSNLFGGFILNHNVAFFNSNTLSNLKSGTTYEVRANWLVTSCAYEYHSPVITFTTEGSATEPLVYWSDLREDNITQTNAVVHAYINNPNNLTVTPLELTLYNPDGSVFGSYWELTPSDVAPLSRINYSLDLSYRLEKALRPNTTYTYQIRCEANGKSWWSDFQSFTTLPPPGPVLTNVWMTPETDQTIKKGSSITFSFRANLPSDFYLHVYNKATEHDTSTPVTFNSTSGTCTYTFSELGSYSVWVGAAHPAGDMASNWITVNVKDDAENPVISNVAVSDVSYDGFNVTYTATDNVGVTAGELSFWIEGEGNSNAMWVPTVNIGGQTWQGYVSATDFGRTDVFYGVNVWAYDASHNYAQYEQIRGIYVPAPPAISDITFVDSRLVLRRGETATPNVIITSPDQQPHSLSELVWTSSDPEIVSVDGNGTITARHLGQTAVYAASPDGTVSDWISIDVKENIGAGSYFTVGHAVVDLNDDINENCSVACMVAEAGQSLAFGVHIHFTNNNTGYAVEYAVREGNAVISGDTLVLPQNASRKNVITANIYDVLDDGSRGAWMKYTCMTVFVDDHGGMLKLPSSLTTLEANALEGTKATTVILPESLKDLTPGCLAGLPLGAIIYFNSDTVTPFDADVVMDVDATHSRDYYWIDLGTETWLYHDGYGCYANYFWLAPQVSVE